MIRDFYDGIVVLDRPISIDNNQIYGVLFNVERELIRRENEDDILAYVYYLVGVARFKQNGGTISDYGSIWTLPEEKATYKYGAGFGRLVSHLMRGEVRLQKYDLGNRIEWNEGEVDDENTSLVISPALIDRYFPNEGYRMDAPYTPSTTDTSADAADIK